MNKLAFKPIFLKTKALMEPIRMALAIQIKGIKTNRAGVRLPSKLPLNSAARDGRNMAGKS